MVLGLFAILTIIIYAFIERPIFAESGCGGTEFCQSTKVVGKYDCVLSGGSCIKDQVGTETIDCTVTETECYGYHREPNCSINNAGVCDQTIGGSRKKVSCCSVAGGGNYDCPNPVLKKVCIPSGECPELRTGTKCGTGKKWCFKLVCPTCDAGAPSDLAVERTGFTTSKVTWTPGTGGYSHKLYVDADKTKVEADCASGCFYTKENAVSGEIVSGLAMGTVYYYRVVNYKDSACSTPSPTVAYLSSCQLSPPSWPMSVGNSKLFTVSASQNSFNEIQKVDFSTNPSATGYFTFTPSDPSAPYQSNVTAQSPTSGAIALKGDVYFNGNPNSVCTSNNADISVTGQGAWWQVKDGDVSAKESLSSDVPLGKYFNLVGVGGFPGIPMYGGSSNLTTSNVSQTTGWLVNSQSTGTKIYNYNFFAGQIPQNVIPADPTNNFAQPGTNFFGYELYKHSGPGNFTTNSGADLNLGSRKVILLVEENADVVINKNITLTDGAGFFGIFTSGKISVNPQVTNLEGIYLSDSSFETGTGNNQLNIRGSVATYGGINLQRKRDLINNTLPAETFEYAPDQILLFPPKLGHRKIRWKEVAP